MSDEPSATVRAWFAGFIVGVLMAMAMLIGVTLTYCVVTLGGKC